MPRRKRTSPLEDVLTLFFELTGFSWHIGIVITLIFFCLGLYGLEYAINYQLPSPTSLTFLFSQLGWLRYLIPATLFLLSFIFGIKTYSTYQKQNYY